MRALVILMLLGGCLNELSGETQCRDRFVFDGPGLSHPYVVPINDRFHVGWRVLDWELDTFYTYHDAIVDGSGQVVPGSQVDHGTELVTLLAAPLGRALYLRGWPEASYEVRLATGELVGAPFKQSQVGEFGTFDGDAFLFIDGGTARRVGLDGTIGAPFTIPQPAEPMFLNRVVASEGVTWIVYSESDKLEVLRIQRGGGALDSAPRRVSDQALDHDVAAGPRELAILTGNRQDMMTWHVLREDGTRTMKPLELPGHPGVRPWFGMNAEPSAYLAVFEAGALMARVTSDGVPSQPFAWPERFSNAPDYVRGENQSMLVFAALVPEGAAPMIRAVPIPFGGEPEASILVQTVDGETRFETCGCDASGSAGGAVAIGLLGVVRRGRRRRAGRADQAPPAQ